MQNFVESSPPFERSPGRSWSGKKLLFVAVAASVVAAGALPAFAGARHNLATYHPAAPMTPGSGPRVAVPASIDGTCHLDVAAALTAWIASVPDGATVVLGTNACYRVESAVSVVGRHGLVFEGSGATLRATTIGTGPMRQVQNRKQLFIKGSTDIVVRNFTIQGVNTGRQFISLYAGQHGIHLDGDQRVLIEHMTIKNVYGDWISVQSDHYVTWQWSSDITIQHNTFENAGRQGLSITSGQHVLIQQNTLNWAGQDLIDIEPDGVTTAPLVTGGPPTHGGANDVRILNNDIYDAQDMFLTITGYAATVSNVSVIGNRLHGKALSIQVMGYTNVPRTGYDIENNVSDTPSKSVYGMGMIRLRNVTNSVVKNNIAPVGGHKAAVAINGSTNIDISGNSFLGATTVTLVDVLPPGLSGPKATAAIVGQWSGHSSKIVHCSDLYGSAPVSHDAVC
jgi:hypothetical protein